MSRITNDFFSGIDMILKIMLAVTLILEALFILVVLYGFHVVVVWLTQ